MSRASAGRRVPQNFETDREILALLAARSDWRKRCIILPEELVEHLFNWHGGQSTATYALASTGMRDLVSLSMIDAAKDELERIKPAKGQKKELKDVIGELQTVRVFWKESSAKEAGMDVDEYEYDGADYGLTAEEEGAIDTHSG